MRSLHLPFERLRPLLLMLPIGIGLAVAIWLARSGSPPTERDTTERAVPVRVVPVVAVDLIPRALGYGNAQPVRVWRGLAEVSGKIVEVHPSLERGQVVREGAQLAAIDPARYELALEQVKAQIAEANAAMAQLDVDASNAEASIAIEQQGVQLAQAQVDRTRQLLETGRSSQAEVEADLQSLLAKQAALQNLQNTQALLPTRRSAQAAQLRVLETQLTQAELDLASTRLIAPFTGRVSAVEIEPSQYVAAGTVLVELDDISATEVVAQIQLAHLKNTIRQATAERPLATLLEPNAVDIAQLLKLEAVVRLAASGFEIEWPARFTRIEDVIDPETRTAGVVVQVDAPYAPATADRHRPPLVKGMFVEVELRGAPIPNSRVIARSALHDGTVLVVGPDQRLDRRSIEVDFVQFDHAVIRSGLESGDQVVVSDLMPPVLGTLLAPETDTLLRDRITRAAQHAGDGR